MASDAKPPSQLKNGNSTAVEKLEHVLASEPARLIPKILNLIIRMILWLIPKQIREYISNLLSILQAKILFQRLGLGKNYRLFSYKTIDREILAIDGVSLKTTHLHPATDDGLKHPCIILRTPYYRYFDYAIGVHLVHKGYHVLLQDVRGRFESGGEFTLAKYEKADSRCTLKWIGEQPWSDKTAGVVGLSMGGYTSWTAYASSLETFEEHGVHVKCVVPIISSCDILKAGTYADLSKKVADPILNLSLMTRYTRLTHILGSPKTVFGSTIGWLVFRMAAVFNEMRTKEWRKKQMHLPLKNIDLIVAQDVPNPRMDILTDPNDPFFTERDHSWSVKLLGQGFIPAGQSGTRPHGCFISGWYDIFARSTIRDFQLAAANAEDPADGRLTLIMGDWQHFDDFITVALRESVRSFDKALRDQKPEKELLPIRVLCVGAEGYFRTQRPLWEQALSFLNPSTSKYSISNENHHAWRQFSSWPPKESRLEYLVLSAGNMMLPYVPKIKNENFTGSALRFELESHHYDSFVWDPFNPTPTFGGRMFGLFEAGIKEQRLLMLRDDVIVYTTPPLKRSVEIAGEVFFDVFSSSSAVSMDVFAKLCIVLPEKSALGKEITYNLCEGIERHTLDAENGEHWPKRIRVRVGPICAQFSIDSRIRIMISGGSFPQFSRNLGYGDPTPSSTRMTTAKHRILWSGSKLELPVTSPYSLEEALSCDNQEEVDAIWRRSGKSTK